MKHTIAPMGSVYHAVLALALAGSCALAQSEKPTTPAAEETELAPITVSAHEGNAVPYDQTGVSVTVLDVGELKKEGIYSLSEALTTAPGVYVVPGGGANQRGNTSDLVIRGMSSQKYVLPMMDGMRLGGLCGGNGLVASNVVSRTPLFGLGSLELVRGAQGAVYGSGAMAGVLYMETPEGKGDPSLTLFNEFGSFDSYTGSATAQGRVGDTAFFVNSTYERTNNDLHFADGSSPAAKHAGRFENWSEALRLDHDINDKNKLTFTYRREDAEYNYYSPYTQECTPYEFRTNLVTLRLQTRATEKYSTSLMAGYYGSDKDFSTSTQRLSNVQLEWRHAYQWDEQNRTTAGVAWTRSAFTAKSMQTKQSQNSNLDSVLSFYAEHSVEPVKNWNNSLALRLDQSNVYEALFTLRASSNYKFNLDRTRVFASVGRGYAAPSSFQRSSATFSDGYTTYYGNPHLRCETNWSVDMGTEHQVAKDHYLSATLFWIRTEDGISDRWSAWWDECHYYNDPGHWTNQGLELALRGTLEKSWNTGYKLAYTLAQPKRGDGSQRPNSARQTWTADIHTSPIEGFTTGFGLTAAAGRVGYDFGTGPERIDSYVVLRWYAQYEVTENLSLHLRVENLTNQKYEVEPNGTPDTAVINPGTAVYAGCTLKF